MNAGPLVLGTRGSALALAQAGLVAAALRRVAPGREIRTERIITTGDARPTESLAALGRGVFVTEIETALRDGGIHAAVHSAKDLPSTLAEDLVIAAYLPRADARDVLVSRAGTLRQLPPGSRVGTSSPRRACQLRALRPDLEIAEMRGNVDTRLRKLARGDYDAIVLAAAGLERLGRLEEVTEWLPLDAIIPCVGQGAIAVEARRDDEATVQLLLALDHAPTRAAVETERAFLAELGAGCRAAVAAHATVVDGRVRLAGMIGAVTGEHQRGDVTGDERERALLGVELARRLLVQGASGYLARAVDALRGRRVAVTRAPSEGDALTALLLAAGAEPVMCETFTIQPVDDPSRLDTALRRLPEAKWLVFTSANAARLTAERMSALQLALPASVAVAVVGPATAAVAQGAFGRVDFLPTRARGERLAAELPLDERDLVLFPRGNLALPALAQSLRFRGAMVLDPVAYHTVPGPRARVLARLVREGVDAVVFTSPSSVEFAEGLSAAVAARGSAAPVLVSIGPSTTAALTALGIRAHEAPTPGVGAIVETLHRALSLEAPDGVLA